MAAHFIALLLLGPLTGSSAGTTPRFGYDEAVPQRAAHAAGAMGGQLSSTQIHNGVVDPADNGIRGSLSASESQIATNALPGGFREISPGVYESPAGLVYGGGGAQGHRFTHVMEHARPDPTKPVHSVFQTTATDLQGLQDEVAGIVDRAWAGRGAATSQGANEYFVTPTAGAGTAGEDAVKVVVKSGTSEVIAAFPCKLGTPKCP